MLLIRGHAIFKPKQSSDTTTDPPIPESKHSQVATSQKIRSLQNIHNASGCRADYRKFPNRGAGRLGRTLGGAIIREGIFSPSSGFLQNKNRTIFG